MTLSRVALAAPSPPPRAASTRRPWLVPFLAGQGQPLILHPESTSAGEPTTLRRVVGKVDGALTHVGDRICASGRHTQRDVVARQSSIDERICDVFLSLRKARNKYGAGRSNGAQQRNLFVIKHGASFSMGGLSHGSIGDARKNIGGGK